jgi:biopolymer transport protein TolQ
VPFRTLRAEDEMELEFVRIAIAATPEGGGFTLWSAFQQAGPIGILTMLLLIAFSVGSWAIILVKWISLSRAQRESEQFVDVFWQSKRLDEIFQKSETMVGSPVAQVFRAGYQELLKVKQRDQKTDDKEKPVVALGGAENVERALRRAQTTEMTKLERLIPFLATVGSTSPFIGLFGTVVGIINAFQDIARQKSANLATVAPGIAEALVATAAGLVAAIPAVIAFNILGSRIKVLGHEMENFSSDFMNIVRRHFF